MNKHTKRVIELTDEIENDPDYNDTIWDYVIHKCFMSGIFKFKEGTTELESIDYEDVGNVGKGKYCNGFRWLRNDGTKWSLVDWEAVINHALNTESGQKEYQSKLETLIS